MCQNLTCRHNIKRTVGWKSGSCITAVRHTNLSSWWWKLINITSKICGKTMWQWKNCQSLFKNSLIFPKAVKTKTPSSFLKCISRFNDISIKFNQCENVLFTGNRATNFIGLCHSCILLFFTTHGADFKSILTVYLVCTPWGFTKIQTALGSRTFSLHCAGDNTLLWPKNVL